MSRTHIPGVWWPKFSSYRLEPGSLSGNVLGSIVPDEGAAVSSYDPWRYVGQDPRGLVRALAPQAALSRWALAVERRIDAPGQSFALNKLETAEVLRWCEAWGVPGLQATTDDEEAATVDYWRSYEEPVLPLVRAVAYWSLALGTLSERPGNDIDRANAATELNRYARGTALILATDSEGGFVPAWSAPSLLCHFSTMALMQAERHPARLCVRCGAPFFPAGYQSLYCTPACKLAANKAAQRSRKTKGAPR